MKRGTRLSARLYVSPYALASAGCTTTSSRAGMKVQASPANGALPQARMFEEPEYRVQGGSCYRAPHD